MLFAPISAAFAIILAAPSAVAATAAARSTGAAEFAAAVSNHARNGWRLRDVAVTEDESATEIRLTYAIGKRGHVLSVRWGESPGHMVEFSQRPSAAPSQDRTYTFEQELADAMAGGVPTELEYACSSYVLYTPGAQVVIDDAAYYTVEQRARRGSGRVLASALESALADGGELVDVIQTDEGGKDQLSLIVDGPDDRLQILAELDVDGAVASVEVRSMPAAGPTEHALDSQRLRRALPGHRIARVELTQGQLGLVLDDGAAVSVDLSARGESDEDCGC